MRVIIKLNGWNCGVLCHFQHQLAYRQATVTLKLKELLSIMLIWFSETWDLANKMFQKAVILSPPHFTGTADGFAEHTTGWRCWADGQSAAWTSWQTFCPLGCTWGLFWCLWPKVPSPPRETLGRNDLASCPWWSWTPTKETIISKRHLRAWAWLRFSVECDSCNHEGWSCCCCLVSDGYKLTARSHRWGNGVMGLWRKNGGGQVKQEKPGDHCGDGLKRWPTMAHSHFPPVRHSGFSFQYPGWLEQHLPPLSDRYVISAHQPLPKVLAGAEERGSFQRNHPFRGPVRFLFVEFHRVFRQHDPHWLPGVQQWALRISNRGQHHRFTERKKNLLPGPPLLQTTTSAFGSQQHDLCCWHVPHHFAFVAHTARCTHSQV